MQQKREDYYIGAPNKTLTRSKLEKDGWYVARVTGKHRHFQHATTPGIFTVPNDDRLIGIRVRNRPTRTARPVLQYLAVVQHTPSGFVVRFPDFPGCITAGRAIVETRRMADEALHGHITAMRAAGFPIPDPSPLTAVVKHRFYPGSVALMVVEVPSVG
jgi:predicted RNase H-like HicB family nuclease/predicted RNA binding protein YcfA (HicA-like mRNA interferase family)